jgi:regulator of protease activity HflC (stomatin/prohibitin superfamily)
MKYHFRNRIVKIGTGCALSLLLLTSVSKINPGEIGIVVNPFGESKGVEKQEITIGVHFLAPWKSVYKFPTYEQNHQWVDKEMFTFQTSEGLPVKAEIGISYHLEQNRIHELFGKYRKGMEEITELYVRNILRDNLNKLSSKMNIEDLFAEKKESFFNQVHKNVNDELEAVGINISHVYIIGKLNVPDVVTEALNRKIEATQKAQQRENELRESEAEAKKIVAKAKGEAESLIIDAESKAKSNALINKSLTPELLKWKHIEKWDGKLPNTIAGSDSNVLLNLK